MTKKAIGTFLTGMEARLKDNGLPLHEYQVLMALRVPEFQNAIAKKMEEGYTVSKVVRVYYTQAPAFIEVLARLEEGEGFLANSAAILGTFKATDYTLVSIAENFTEPEDLKPEGSTLVPFPMALPTQTEDFLPDEEEMQIIAEIDARQNRRFSQLVGSNGGPIELLGTNCQTGRPSSTRTGYTSKYTTSIGGGQTKPDSKTDYKTDDNTDYKTDVNDDSDS